MEEDPEPGAGGFTAGLTLSSGETLTVDVEQIDGQGVRYRTEEGTAFAPWHEVKAAMLASPDHMLETAGYMFEVSEMLAQQEQRQPYDAEAMRRQGLGLLQQVAPALCPNGASCPLAPGD